LHRPGAEYRNEPLTMIYREVGHEYAKMRNAASQCHDIGEPIPICITHAGPEFQYLARGSFLEGGNCTYRYAP